MIKNLHELDKRLWTTLDIEICGASSAIIKSALNRNSMDIDVVKTSYPLDDPKMRKVLDEILYIPNDLPSWLNSESEKSIYKVLPRSFRFDKESIVGESFQKLNPTLISNADLVICKLAIEENNRRNNDFPDIQRLALSIKDAECLYEKINEFSKYNHPLALEMEGNFKQLRHEFVWDFERMPITNGDDIAKYSLKRYGIKPSNNKIEGWNDDIQSMIKKPATIVGNIDRNASKMIKEGNLAIAKKDNEYRSLLSKGIDYGMDL